MGKVAQPNAAINKKKFKTQVKKGKKTAQQVREETTDNDEDQEEEEDEEEEDEEEENRNNKKTKLGGALKRSASKELIKEKVRAGAAGKNANNKDKEIIGVRFLCEDKDHPHHKWHLRPGNAEVETLLEDPNITREEVPELKFKLDFQLFLS